MEAVKLQLPQYDSIRLGQTICGERSDITEETRKISCYRAAVPKHASLPQRAMLGRDGPTVQQHDRVAPAECLRYATACSHGSDLARCGVERGAAYAYPNADNAWPRIRTRHDSSNHGLYDVRGAVHAAQVKRVLLQWFHQHVATYFSVSFAKFQPSSWRPVLRVIPLPMPCLAPARLYQKLPNAVFRDGWAWGTGWESEANDTSHSRSGPEMNKTPSLRLFQLNHPPA